MYKAAKGFIFLVLSIWHIAVHAQNMQLTRQQESFEEFYVFFKKHYASFNEKGINWDSTYAMYKPRLSQQTSDSELFDIFCEMVKPLNDSHVTITTKDGKNFSASRPSRILREFAKTEGPKRKTYISMLDSTLKMNGFEMLKPMGAKYKGVPMLEYATSSKYGYLRINRCYAKRHLMNGIFLEHRLETIFKELSLKDGLIIDIRFNPGGTDNVAFKVAGRLTSTEYIGHYKQVKLPNTLNSFSKLKPRYVQPTGKSKFLNRVMLLTNDKSISAADVLALILSGNPNVTIIGENTNGSYSDIYPAIFPKKLSNGFKVTLSNQRYLSKDLINYEGKGLPVDFEVLNTLEDFETMVDPLINKGIEVLNKK